MMRREEFRRGLTSPAFKAVALNHSASALQRNVLVGDHPPAGRPVVGDILQGGKGMNTIKPIIDNTSLSGTSEVLRLDDELLVQYSDGWNYQNHEAGRLGYPMSWLKEVDYADSGVSPCEPTCI